MFKTGSLKLWIILLTCSTAIYSYIALKKRSVGNTQNKPPHQKLDAVVSSNVTMKEVQPSHSGWSLHAQKIIVSSDKHIANCYDVTCSLLLANGLYGTLRTPHVIVDKKHRTIKSDTLTNATFDTFGMQASGIIYNAKTHTLSTTCPTTLTGEQFTLNAGALTAYAQEKKVEFSGGVHCILHTSTSRNNC